MRKPPVFGMSIIDGRTVNSVKPVGLTKHAEGYYQSRGFSKAEVEAVIRNGPWRPAARGRMESDLGIEFDSDWNGRHYKAKTIRPIFVDEPAEIVVITVYVYYY
jgi:hypothetical protein